jgi:hypothetical protein
MFGPPKRCPACSSTSIRRSRRGWLRPVCRVLCLRPFRCDSCDRRVWRFALSDSAQPTQTLPPQAVTNN